MSPRLLILLPCAVLALRAAPSDPDPWHPGVPAEVYVAPGRATTVLLRTPLKVASISQASPVVSCSYDKALNQLELTPTVRDGGIETNLNLRIGRDVYVLLVKIVTDARAQALRCLEPDGAGDPDEDDALSRSRPLRPLDVDLVGAARDLERAAADPVFRRARPGMALESIGRLYAWNDCVVELARVARFPAEDLLVFEVRWANRTRDALRIGPSQYRLLAAGAPVPVIARYQKEADDTVYPGEARTVYLAVQGYRLSRDNDWGLALPPDSAALDRPARG